MYLNRTEARPNFQFLVVGLTLLSVDNQHLFTHLVCFCQARWALTSEKAANRAERGRRLEANKNEMELANVELIARRSARLKDLYQQLNDR